MPSTAAYTKSAVSEVGWRRGTTMLRAKRGPGRKGEVWENTRCSLATLLWRRSFSAARAANSLTASTKAHNSVTGRPNDRVQAISFFGAGCCARPMSSNTLLALLIGLSLHSCAPVPAQREVAAAAIRLETLAKGLGTALREHAGVSVATPGVQKGDRRDSHVPLIDEAHTKILLDSVRSAANAHIHSVGCVARPAKRLVNTARDEVECRSTFHLDGWAGVMSQDESWNVIGWVVPPPPAFPVHVGPGAANRSEYVSSENPGANILEAPRSEVVIAPPVVPPSALNKVRWIVCVGTNHWCKSVPPTPSGFLMS